VASALNRMAPRMAPTRPAVATNSESPCDDPAGIADRIATFETERMGLKAIGVHEKHGKLEGVWKDCVIIERLITENIG
jgi:hypothetical protein